MNGLSVREGGQYFISQRNHIYEREENDKIFMKEIQKIMDNLRFSYDIYQKLEPTIRKIERENNLICPIALVLSLKFTINLNDFSPLDFPKDRLHNFLHEEWKLINTVVQNGHKKYLNHTNNIKLKPEEFIRYRIYKAKLLPTSNCDRYISIWKREILLHQMETDCRYVQIQTQREKNEIIRLQHKKSNFIQQFSKMHEKIIKARNGENACWINTVLYLFFSHPQLQFCLVHNDFIKKAHIPSLRKLFEETWDNLLYQYYYNIFKTNCDDIPEFGDYGNPHAILSFMVHGFVNTNIYKDLKVDVSFDITINSFNKLQAMIQKEKVYGIIKGITPISFSSGNFDSMEELNSDHFVCYIQHGEEWTFFDALRGGTFPKKVSLQDVYYYNNIRDGQGSCPYYFLIIT